MTDTGRLWAKYRKSPSTANRNRLAEAYYPLCITIAARFASAIGMKGETNDFVGYGAIGLIDAVEKYSPERGMFTAYAPFRIKGAIIDALRNCHLDGRIARRGEVGASVSGFDAMDLEEIGCLTRDGMQSRVEIRDLYRTALAAPGMTAQLRRVARYRYEQRMTLLAIGEKVGLSEGRICQMVGRLDIKLRTFFSRHGVSV